jgi:RNA polymerase sigma-70 factor (ECF subfamily)
MTTREESDAPLGAEVTAQRGYLLRYARSKLRDAAIAEDVVHDTLLAALQSLDRFEHRSALRTWLTAILANKITDAVRRDLRGAAVVDSASAHDGVELPTGDEAEGDAELTDWRDPERVLAGRQAADALLRRLNDMAPLAQRVFVLREVEGLSNGEAARELGLTPERGALLLHRTRARLRQGLHEARVL